MLENLEKSEFVTLLKVILCLIRFNRADEEKRELHHTAGNKKTTPTTNQQVSLPKLNV